MIPRDANVIYDGVAETSPGGVKITKFNVNLLKLINSLCCVKLNFIFHSDWQKSFIVQYCVSLWIKKILFLSDWNILI